MPKRSASSSASGGGVFAADEGDRGEARRGDRGGDKGAAGKSAAGGEGEEGDGEGERRDGESGGQAGVRDRRHVETGDLAFEA